MAGVFQVVAECAHVTMPSPFGRVVQLALKGALVPADAPELPRLLDLGFVAEVGAVETGGVDAAGVPAGSYPTPAGAAAQVQAKAEPAGQPAVDREVAERRAAAKAKLPADGSAPHGNAAKDVWVEFLDGRGYDYDELVKQEKADLVELAK